MQLVIKQVGGTLLLYELNFTFNGAVSLRRKYCFFEICAHIGSKITDTGANKTLISDCVVVFIFY
jgi:hypothetical protein